MSWANGICGECWPHIRLNTTSRARTWRWRRMRRYGELSRGVERSSPRQFFPGCTIAMCGYNFREGQEDFQCLFFVSMPTKAVARSRSRNLLTQSTGPSFRPLEYLYVTATGSKGARLAHEGHTRACSLRRPALWHRKDAPDMDAVAPHADKPSVDAVSAFRRPTKSPRSFPWLGTGIRVFILFLIGALIVVVAREWDWWVGSAVEQSTDDAYLQADMTPLAAKSPGYVRSVPVQDFQRVKAGDLLVEIVDDDYRAQFDQAQANVDAARAAIDNIEEQKHLQEVLI